MAMRAHAAPLKSASGVRSPIAMASPGAASSSEYVVRVTATSATGTWYGPTIGSRVTRPVTLRSPIVTRKPLLATAGRCSTRRVASARRARASSCGSAAASDESNGTAARGACVDERSILGVLPKSVSMGRSMHVVPRKRSVSTRRCSVVAWPHTAYGQRSRSAIARKASRLAGRTAST